MSYFVPMLVIGAIVLSFFIFLVVKWYSLKKKEMRKRLEDEKKRMQELPKKELKINAIVAKQSRCSECGSLVEKGEYCPYCGKKYSIHR